MCSVEGEEDEPEQVKGIERTKLEVEDELNSLETIRRPPCNDVHTAVFRDDCKAGWKFTGRQ